jgi:ankyrin repeat protein
MTDQLNVIFAKLRGSADFADTDFSDVNACCTDGDNALHCAVRWGDVSAAKTLVAAGVDVNKAGELGYTPLHVACLQGNVGMVRLLVDCGADVFAMSEGDIPFSSACLAGHDDICDLLASVMKLAQSHDPNNWTRSRIAQLQREIAKLETKLETKIADRC